MIVEKAGALFGLDTPAPLRLNKRYLHLRGWFVPNKYFEGSQELFVVVGGIRVPLIMDLPRHDVATHLKDEDAAYCGYLVRFRDPGMSCNIQFVLRCNGADIDLASVPYTPEPVPVKVATQGGDTSDYAKWLADNEEHLFWPEEEMRERVSALRYRPTMAILFPAFNTQSYLLKRSVASVLEQSYSDLQLCVLVTSSDCEAIRYVKNLAAQDERVTFMLPESAEGLTSAANQMLEATGGEFVVLLRPGDELHPAALVEVVRRLNATPEADLVYSDEDMVDLYGTRSQPLFKPEFDPDLLLASNYVGYLAAFRREAADSAGGFRFTTEESGYWDLVLRVTAFSKREKVQHIAKPLYHRHRYDVSAAGVSASKRLPSYKVSAGIVSEHIGRTGTHSARVERGFPHGYMRIQYRHRDHIPVAIICRVVDGSSQISVLKPNIGKQAVQFYELLDYVLLLSEQSATGLTAASISSLNEMAEEVFLFINSPLESVNHAFIDELVAQAMREECGLVTGISVDVDENIVHAGLLAGPDGELRDAFKGRKFPIQDHTAGLIAGVRRVDAIEEHFFAVRREHLAAAGGLAAMSASHMSRLASKLCENATRAGLRVLVTPYAISTLDKLYDYREVMTPMLCGSGASNEPVSQGTN